MLRKYTVEELIYEEQKKDSIIIDKNSDIYIGFLNGIKTFKRNIRAFYCQIR